MRQPRKGIINAIKAMTSRIVPPMTVPVSTKDLVSPVINGIQCVPWLQKAYSRKINYIAHGQANTEM